MSHIFQNNNFTQHSSIIQSFIVIPALVGTPNQPYLLSLPASTRGNAGSSSKEEDLLYSVHSSSVSLKIYFISFSLHNHVNILHSRFLQRFRNFHFSLITSAGLSRGYFILKRRGGTFSDFIVKVYILCIFTQQLDL